MLLLTCRCNKPLLIIEGSYLCDKIERSVYNKRKRKLFPYLEILRRQMSETEDHFIIDSMPLEVCKLSRSGRSTICKEHAGTAPNKGFCAAQSLHFYGYKLHAVSTVGGVFTSIDLSAAAEHDIHFIKDVKKPNEQLHLNRRKELYISRLSTKPV